jgi:hypothetical protein
VFYFEAMASSDSCSAASEASRSATDERLQRAQGNLEKVAQQCGLAGNIFYQDHWKSSFSVGLGRWCKEFSWRQCRNCGKKEMAKMTPARFNKAIRGSASPGDSTTLCAVCRSGKGFKAPRPSEIPMPLHQLCI